MKNLSKKSLASRANGAKSHGPVSIDGKRRSSANSLRHGLLAKIIVLDNESKDVFAQFFDEHLQKLNPADGVEYAVVEEIVAAAWRLRRIWEIETTLLNQDLARSTANSEPGRSTAAFCALASSNKLQLIDRYETRLQRAYQRALNNLMLLRQFPRDEEPFPEPNEPIRTPAPQPGPVAPTPISQPKEPTNEALPNEPETTQQQPAPSTPAKPKSDTPIAGNDDQSPTTEIFRPFRLPDWKERT